MTIGERIKNRRIELNMTQEELAHRVGYKSRSSINKIELSRELPLKKVKMVADALETSPSVLMGWTEEDNITIGEITSTDIPRTLREYDATRARDADELELLQKWRKLDTYGKQMVSAVLDTAYFQAINEEKTRKNA